jgi:carbamate kinase
MRILVALGGNALLHRGEPLTADNQRRNIGLAAEALVPLAIKHELVITHGNGPQVGLLALQNAAYKADESFPLDMLDAETEGMIGYMIEQELNNRLPADIRCATILTQVEVDPNDPAFTYPSKPIGPVYNEQQALRLASHQGWHIAADGDYYRRVVPSPRPRRILELSIIELLLDQGVIVICAGGGGIPTVFREDGTLIGVEAVIDKDLASSLLAQALKADMLLMLTDVDAVYRDWGKPGACPIRHISSQAIKEFSFEPGTMAPKVEAAIEFVEKTGAIACIGALEDAQALIDGEAGTIISDEVEQDQA